MSRFSEIRDRMLMETPPPDMVSTAPPPKFTREERLRICSVCDQHQDLFGGFMRCRACNCAGPVQIKASIPAASCPLKKW